MKFLKKWLDKHYILKRDLKVLAKLVCFGVIVAIIAFFIKSVSGTLNIL
tara:strand:- start:51297 stop:51443 length:147 start_codon:yes stop_codon:yes gene_type:complete